jgi:hypothetical protein
MRPRCDTSAFPIVHHRSRSDGQICDCFSLKALISDSRKFSGASRSVTLACRNAAWYINCDSGLHMPDNHFAFLIYSSFLQETIHLLPCIGWRLEEPGRHLTGHGAKWETISLGPRTGPSTCDNIERGQASTGINPSVASVLGSRRRKQTAWSLLTGALLTRCVPPRAHTA